MKKPSHRPAVRAHRVRGRIGLLSAFALVAVACATGDDAASEPVPTAAAVSTPTTTAPAAAAAPTTTADPLAGAKVTVFGPESSDEEAGAMQDALDAFAAESGIEIVYTGARDFSDQINAQAAGGNPPDIAVFPQPGKVGDFADAGWIEPVPDSVKRAVEGQWPAGSLAPVTVDGELYGIPNKSDLKSIVWYNTSIFEDGGYAVPQSLEELQALTIQMMIGDDIQRFIPWCVGIESGPATGWVFTDWMEDLILRMEDENLYDQWVAGDVPFADPRILAVAETVLALWHTPGAVFAAGGSIAATPFGDNGEALALGECAMHRQASFFAAFLPEGTSVGPGQDIDVFYFPAVAAKGNRPVLTAGTYVSAFRDAPEVWAVMEFFGSAEYAQARQSAQTARKGGGQSGFLSANLDQDLNVYNELERSFVEILQTASPARFDGSDLMPAAVGAGAFWTEGTSAVNGDKTVAEAFAAIDAAWPR